MIVLRSANPFLHLFVAFFVFLSSNQFCNANETISAPSIQTTGRATNSNYPLVSPKVLTSVPSKVDIYQYDSSPLGQRQPLLLVHGLLGERHPYFRWKELADFLSQDKTCQQQFKIYLATFNSQSSLKELSKQFNVAIRNLAPEGGLTLIAISLSGLIVRDAMKNPDVARCINRVLTLGTFFRGSPLFCADWMRQSIQKNHLSPFYRLARPLSYKVYFARHKNLQADYAWDNVDGQRPTITNTKKTRDNELASSTLIPTDPIQLSIDHKFVVYAGYLHNQFFPKRRSGIYSFLISPFTFLKTTLPAHLGREHAALRLLNYLIADSIPARGSSKVGYPLNDGIAPITSCLLLSNDFVAKKLINDEKPFDQIQVHSDAKKARLFDNIDHLTFIERVRPAGSPQNITDMLSKTEEARPIFSWILKDILE